MAPGGYLTAPPGSQGLIPGAFMVPGVPVSQFNQQSAMQVCKHCGVAKIYVNLSNVNKTAVCYNVII